MRRITRYIVSEFFQVFLVVLTVMSSLMVVGLLLVEAMREGLAPLSAIRLLPFILPMALLYAVPGTTLFAVCSIYGRMSANNEITAVKSAGASPMTMVWPVLTVSFLLSLGVIWLNDLAVTWGRLGAKRVLLESVEQIVYGMLRSHKSYTSPSFSITVRGVEGQKLLQPTISLRVNDDGPRMVCMAEEAELRCDPEQDTLRILLRDCEINWGKVHMNFPDTTERVVPLSDATRRGNDDSRPANIELRRIPEELRDQAIQIEGMEQDMALAAAMQMLTGDLDDLTGTQWAGQQSQMQLSVSRLNKLRTEPWRRVANGFSCFFFALVGVPVAIQLRFADVWTTFMICFLPILVVYYPLLMFGTDLAKSGVPPYCVWMGNGALGVVGYFFTRRMLRY